MTVFPTRVGMNRSSVSPQDARNRIPHAGGDEPEMLIEIHIPAAYSPRGWG